MISAVPWSGQSHFYLFSRFLRIVLGAHAMIGVGLTYIFYNFFFLNSGMLHLRGAFNKFPDFFVQAFKIVVDSWNFTMLLLYILWEDWSIFMISGSNEQLQQQLEYTLLKPDCHSWWISKMQSGREVTLEEWYAIKFCFKFRKNARETYGSNNKNNNNNNYNNNNNNNNNNDNNNNKVIYCGLFKRLKVDYSDKWYIHKPKTML